MARRTGHNARGRSGRRRDARRARSRRTRAYPAGSVIHITATERRRRSLSPAEWVALHDNEAFWRLVETGFVGVSQTSVSRREIHGKRFVGRAIAGEAELVVQEK